MKIIYDPRVLEEDLAALDQRDPGRRQELIARILKAVDEIITEKGVPQTGMRPPYRGWYRKKLFSHRPVPGEHPDLRLIYQWSEDRTVLRILAIGRRKPRSSEDIYQVAAKRLDDYPDVSAN